jgi:hypothetical protein
VQAGDDGIAAGEDGAQVGLVAAGRQRRAESVAGVEQGRAVRAAEQIGIGG